MAPAKFEIGEAVMLRAIEEPSINTDNTTVLDRQYVENGVCAVTQETLSAIWAYQVDSYCETDVVGRHIWLGEPILRKRPPPADESFEEIVASLKSTKKKPEIA